MARGPEDWFDDWIGETFLTPSGPSDSEPEDVDTGDLPPELAVWYERLVMGNPHYERMDDFEKDQLLRTFDRGFYSMPFGFDVNRSRKEFFEELDISEQEQNYFWADWAEWYE